MKNYEKPEYIYAKRDSELTNIEDLIREVFNNESFAVLATKGDRESYTSLISFANSDDLKIIGFASPIDTKKIQMLKENENVSILIDNRSKSEKNLNELVGITCIGKAKILKNKKEIDKWSKILINKHNYLDEFINAETTAIVLVYVSNFYYVSSFQEVIEWNTEIKPD